MATTQTVYGIDQVKGPAGQGGELHAYRVSVRVDGTYLTATKPTFDLLAELQKRHQGITAVAVKKVVTLQDGIDSAGANRFTPPNANIALTSTGNKVVTFRLDTTDATHSNGDANAEIADGTALAHVFLFLAILVPTESGSQ